MSLEQRVATALGQQLLTILNMQEQLEELQQRFTDLAGKVSALGGNAPGSANGGPVETAPVGQAEER